MWLDSRDDVDTTHLLGNHHHERGEGSAAEARNGEQLDEALGVVGAVQNLPLDLELGMDVVEVSSGLDGMVTEPEQRLHGLLVLVLFHVPTRRLGAEEDQGHEGNGWDKGTAELKSPSNGANMTEDEVGSSAEKNAEGGPHF